MSKIGLFPALLALPTLLLAGSGPAIPAGERPAGLALSQPASAENLVHYTVRPGDTWQALAARGFANPADWKAAARFNRLPETAGLKPGSVLSLQMQWLKTVPIKAAVAAWRGNVVVTDAAGPRSLSKGMAIGEGDLIATSGNSFVSLRLPDGSQVSLPSSSAIRISRLRHVVLTDSVDRRFLLERGSSDTRVTPMTNRSSRFLISTPVAVAAVRGTEYRVTFTPDTHTQTTSVTRGLVEVYRPVGKAGTMALPAGQGGSISDTVAEGPVPLLAAPKIAELPPERQGRLVSIRLQPQGGAARFRVELATDATFADRMAEQEVVAAADGRIVATFTNIDQGLVHVRVTAIDRLGLAGFPTVAEFQRRIDPDLAREDRRRQQRHDLAELGEDIEQSPEWYAAGSELDDQLYAAAAEDSEDADGTEGAGGAGGGSGAGGAMGPGSGDGGLFLFGPAVGDGQWLPIGNVAARATGGAARPVAMPDSSGGGGWGGAGRRPSSGSGTDDDGMEIITTDPAPPPSLPDVEQPSGNGSGGVDKEVGGTDPDAAVVVPEPSAWLMLIAGFGLIGTMLRRQRQTRFRAE